MFLWSNDSALTVRSSMRAVWPNLQWWNHLYILLKFPLEFAVVNNIFAVVSTTDYNKLNHEFNEIF